MVVASCADDGLDNGRWPMLLVPNTILLWGPRSSCRSRSSKGEEKCNGILVLCQLLCRRILHREIDETSSQQARLGADFGLGWRERRFGGQFGFRGRCPVDASPLQNTAVGTSPGQGVEWPKHDGWEMNGIGPNISTPTLPAWIPPGRTRVSVGRHGHAAVESARCGWSLQPILSTCACLPLPLSRDVFLKYNKAAVYLVPHCQLARIGPHTQYNLIYYTCMTSATSVTRAS